MTDAHRRLSRRSSAKIQLRPESDLAALLELKRLQLLRFVVVVKVEAGIAAALEPFRRDAATTVDLGLQLRVLRGDFADCMGCRHIALFPALRHALLLVLQMQDKLDRPLQDSTLVFIAVWDKARELIDALVDCLASAALD